MKQNLILTKESLENLPSQPGIYIFRDITGKIIYIGAASNLKKRVSSYFRKDSVDSKTGMMISKISSIDYEIHSSKESAFLRERELIRIHNPPYNIDWKDDKEYPMIRITRPDDTEKFSRVFVVREITKESDWYFSRKKDVKALRYSIRSLRSIFPIANKVYCFRRKKPCLDYSIKRCLAPCTNKVPLVEYQRMVDQFILFLRGKKSELIDDLIIEMNVASDNLEFERAAALRDKISRIESVLEYNIDSSQPRERDYLCLIEESSFFLLLVFWMTDGKLINLESRYLGFLEHLDRKEIITAFIQKYYIEGDYIPEVIEVDTDLEDDFRKYEIWLSKRKGKTIKLNYNTDFCDSSVFKPHLIGQRNELKEQLIKDKRTKISSQTGLSELKDFLNLKRPPIRIECYDISNLQGTLPVGSMIVMEKGTLKKSDYRRFKIKNVPEKPNDVAMLEEIIERRMKHSSDSFSPVFPDLLVIDGGKPQVNRVYKVLKKCNINIPVIGLAKKEESVYLPNTKNPLDIPKNSSGLQLLKLCRDEAHRFAISYHKKRRFMLPKSELDRISGVGLKRRNALLRHFRDIEEIKNASVEELCAVETINRKIAEKIYMYFRAEH
ncbi:MAG: excinuclease ABC subunit UvrC [Candidatus Hodarchaeales archaeon]